MQVKWDEMFEEKARPERSRREEEIVEVKVKKPRKKAVAKKVIEIAKDPSISKKSVARKKIKL